ncbi:MAG TPA: hypothetical protein PKD85_03260, partial [Saprospiraceae bacterium]|nr:hypothetical protein [Saprospiraceae bacterium]
MEIEKIVIVIVIIALILWALMKYQKDGYRYLPSAYGPESGGIDGEYNDECLAYPGNQFCMMTDGTPGVCVLNGICTPSMELDLMQYRSDIK